MFFFDSFELKKLIKVVLSVQLKWSQRPKDVETSAGKPVYVACSADGQPAPKIEWTKVGDEKSQFFGPELRFASIGQSDAGFYECRARNGVEKDLVAKIKIDVLGK